MNNKGADQTARMRMLVCAFVVRKPPKQVFSHHNPNEGCELKTYMFEFSHPLPILLDRCVFTFKRACQLSKAYELALGLFIRLHINK